MKTNLFFVFYPLVLLGIIFGSYGGGGSGGGGGGTSYGTSNISINASSVSIPQGGSATLRFNITLASGISYSTGFYLVNQQQIYYSSGITITATPQYGNPTFSGNFVVNVPKSASPGIYKALIGANGGDPSNGGQVLNITVYAPSNTPVVTVPSSVTTTPTTQATTAQTTSLPPAVGSGPVTLPTTTIPSTAPQKPTFDLLFWIVSALLIAAFAWIALKKMKWIPGSLPPIGP